MFGYRTPAKAGKSVTEEPPKIEEKSRIEDTETPTTSVRKSIGEWESGISDKTSISPPLKKSSKDPKTMPSLESKRRTSLETTGKNDKGKTKYIDRLTEAKACVVKAKLNLNNSRNLKTDIKIEVLQAIERLYQLVKESETVKSKKLIAEPKKIEKETEKKTEDPEEKAQEPDKETQGVQNENSLERIKDLECERIKDNAELKSIIEEHARLLKANTDTIEKLQETLEKKTYASVAAAFTKRQAPEQTALHSIVVTAKDETETGEEVLNRIRKALNAKEGGVPIEKIRKAKDRKVIVGCRTENERQQLTEKLRTSGESLNIEDIKNKNPLVILKDVLQFNSDEDILSALRNQNKDLFMEIDAKEKVEIAYKKRTRNIHTNHVVMRVPPKLWQKMVDAESVHIDLQRVKVADQSPLVQCSLCLGYGHGRRFCKETITKCSHCGGPHMRTECADWLAGEAPSCCNCLSAKADKSDHNAFSQECTIRRKWEALARATVAYC